MERIIETLMVKARWLLAPVYLGLSLAMIALGIKFFQEAFHLLVHIFTLTEVDMVLIILSLIDIALVGGLLVMIMMGGYENFVSSLDQHDEKDKLSWLGKMDASVLKQKVAASIVAISAIHLLKVYMNIQNSGADNSNLIWYVVIHLTFVVSAVLMGLLERWTKHMH
jgi:uncharacterized protein (TIGR00645 family)